MRLQRRRVAIGAGAASLVVLVVVGAALVANRGPTTSPAPPVAAPSATPTTPSPTPTLKRNMATPSLPRALALGSGAASAHSERRLELSGSDLR